MHYCPIFILIDYRCLFDKHSLLGFGQAFNGDIFIHSFNGYYSLKINVFFRFIVSITYTGRMEAGEFTAFPFIALNPKGDVSVKYKAYITYEDGVVVPFDGSEEAKGYQPTIHLRWPAPYANADSGGTDKVVGAVFAWKEMPNPSE